MLSIGTRGKPRTLQVPGENLPKVYNLLEDPDDWRGKAVLVVGGGDSACEAALALADAGAKVMISYRGKGFNRAAPKNKQSIERYAAEGRIKAKLQSQVLLFDAGEDPDPTRPGEMVHAWRLMVQERDPARRPQGNNDEAP